MLKYLSAEAPRTPRTAPEVLDHQPAIHELEALRLDLDLELPQPDQFASPISRALGASATNGDHLRLQEPPEVSGHEMAASLARILGTDTSRGAISSEAAIKEARMRRVLEALAAMQSRIRNHGGIS